MGNFTEGFVEDAVQGIIFPLTTKQFGVESDRSASTLEKSEHNIQKVSVNTAVSRSESYRWVHT